MLSIITPVYNKRKTLPRVIESLSSLSRLIPSELILVDDKSTDGGTEYTQSISSQTFDLKKVFLKKNSGPGAARNAGLNVATQKYVMFLDGDDEIVVEDNERGSNITGLLSLLDSSVDIVQIRNNRQRWVRAPEIETPEAQESRIVVIGRNPEMLDQIQMVQCWGYLIKRQLIISKRIRFLETRIGEDQPFIVEVFLNAKTYSETGALKYLHHGNCSGAATAIQESYAGDYVQAIEHISRLKAQAPNKRRKFLKQRIRFLKGHLPWYCLPYLRDNSWLDQRAILDHALQDMVFVGERENREQTAAPTDELRRLSENA